MFIFFPFGPQLQNKQALKQSTIMKYFLAARSLSLFQFSDSKADRPAVSTCAPIAAAAFRKKTDYCLVLCSVDFSRSARSAAQWIWQWLKTHGHTKKHTTCPTFHPHKVDVKKMDLRLTVARFAETDDLSSVCIVIPAHQQTRREEKSSISWLADS